MLGGRPCRFSLDEVIVATDNFDKKRLLGVGGEGEVYKGHIQIHGVDTTVAIKLLTSNSRDRFREEINLVSGLHHENLLSLKGYCEELNFKILVYEYIDNGSLAMNLYPTCFLDWMELLDICIGAARGLDYLHHGTSHNHKIIHRDVKPGNILLDENWGAKLSDFGLLKRGLSSNPLESDPIKTDLRGTFGYYAPEYVFKNEVSRKTDVYAFGVVLLEVVCRKKREWPLYDESNSDTSKAEEVMEEIDEWARRNIAPDVQRQISVKCLDKFIEIARRCLLRDPKTRPRMADVVSMLQEAQELQNKKSSIVLYFSNYNSTSKKVETSTEDSLLVRVILKELLQVTVEEKNVSKYEVYRKEHSQKVTDDLCLPLLFTGEKYVYEFDMFIQLYQAGKLTSLLGGSPISFSCGSCGYAKTCHICALLSRFAVCKVCDTLTMLRRKQGTLRYCPNCRKDQLYLRTLIHTSQGDVWIFGSSLSCDDHSERGLGVVEGDIFEEAIPLTTRVHHFELAITLIMWILALCILHRVRIWRKRSIHTNSPYNSWLRPPAFNLKPDFLGTFLEALLFCSQLILKPVGAFFMFFAANISEAFLFCSQFLKPLLADFTDFVVEIVKLPFALVLIYLLVWFGVVVMYSVIKGLFHVIKQLIQFIE